jgi:phospholipid-binding lipoprotein MlaA
MRGLLAAAILAACLLGAGPATAQIPGRDAAGLTAGFREIFAATARNAALGARNEAVRRRQVAAALSPRVIQFLVQRPGQIGPMIRGLAAAAPDIAPAVVRGAMASFPGFADQIAQAAGLAGGLAATAASAPAATAYARPGIAAAAGRRQVGGHAARVAAWAISAIAQNSPALEQIMSRALAAVPGGEVAVARAVQSAYPGFAQRIAAATGVAAAVAQRPHYTPAPAVGTAGVPLVIARPAIIQPAVVQPVARRAPAAAPAQQRQPDPGPSLPPGLRLADSGEDEGEIADPLEAMNRIVFAFNNTLDLTVVRPLAIGYNWLMPDPVIQSVRRFFLNLDAPVILANDLLQGDLGDAGVTLGRFAVNSTVGVLGLFDPAASFGWARHHADFGQTLHSYNVGSGPYLVLPLFGPGSTRGGLGKVVDIAFQPLSYLLTTVQNLTLGAARAVVKREELLDPLDELRENSIDFYTGLKAAYWQARQVELNKGISTGVDGGADRLFDATN